MLLICLLTPSDVDAYRELRLFGLKESPTAFGSSYERESVQEVDFFEQRIMATENRWTVGAWIEDHLIGVLSFVRDDATKTRHRGALYAMYVHPEWRGRGVGRQLMQEMLKRVDEVPGLRWVRLSVTDGNVAAERLYESFGFKCYGDEPEVLLVNGRYYGERHLIREIESKR